MPDRPLRPCAKSGCSKLVTTGYCADHCYASRDRDRWRGSAASRGYDSSWKRTRLAALKRDKYLCQPCLDAGRITAATEVHHLCKVITHPHLRLDLTNLMSVCSPCHEEMEKEAT